MTKTRTKERDTAPALFKDADAAEVQQQTKPAAVAAPTPKVEPKKTGTAVAKAERKAVLADEASDEIATLLRVVADPKCDVDKAERIMAMIKSARAERAQIFYDRAYNAMQAKLPVINKDNKIVIEKNNRVVQSTPFASYENIQRITRPILHEHGFTLEHRTEPGREGLGVVVVSTLSYSKGDDYRHAKTATLSLKIENSGSKNDIQGVSSSISYGKRINTNTLLDLISSAPQDMDRDGHDAEKKRNLRPTAGAAAELEKDDQPASDVKISGVQAKDLLKVIDDCGVEATVFMEKYKITAVHELPAKFYNEAVKSCRDYAARVKEAGEKRRN